MTISQKDRRKIGKEIRQRRLKHKWTQEEFADIIGCRQSFLSLLEAGKKPLPLNLARNIDKAFSTDTLFEDMVLTLWEAGRDEK